MPIIINDKRWMALKTLEERKKVFKQYQESLVDKEKVHKFLLDNRAPHDLS
jgi:hypothetical protein